MLDRDMVKRVLGWQHGKFAGVKVLTKSGNERYVLGRVDGTSYNSGYICCFWNNRRKRFDLGRVIAMMSENGHTFVSGQHFSHEKWLQVNKLMGYNSLIKEAA